LGTSKTYGFAEVICLFGLDMVFQIDFFDYVYMSNFYNNIIPSMNKYFRSHRDKKLVFNFADLRFLSPSIIPNILKISDIYKNFFNNKKIKLNLSWNPELLSYLYSIDFFKYSNKLELFDYDEEMLGGLVPIPHENNCRLIFSEKNSSEDEMKLRRAELCGIFNLELYQN
jgi:hypothetical protein